MKIRGALSTDNKTKRAARSYVGAIMVLLFSSVTILSLSAQTKPVFSYVVSIPNPIDHKYQVELHTSGWNQDTIQFKMPRWMPGYYQIMDYGKDVANILAKASDGTKIPLSKIDDSTWEITGIRDRTFNISYTIETKSKFVATSYVDMEHAYLVPENSFLYVEGFLNNPVSVKIVNNPSWNKIATGLEPVEGSPGEFTASDFDILYDCPILLGNLETLPSFKVKGVDHHFIGYKLGEFDHDQFINNLKSVVQAAVNIIGDIPFDNYTFIAIGPGNGGIEHLNNTTISFDGNQLKSEQAMNKVMNFLAHEYFHHYNVKRIRPFELGPFNYGKGNKTNLLWISEGLSVYFEYLIVKRAGIISEGELFDNFENSINAYENNAARKIQSLTQASFSTWEDGPFGKKGESISYYEKGPIIGLALDFAIRNATQNKKSLDDVMQFLYWEFYKKKQRGFTDAEFQEACETIAGIPLGPLFEYVYTTKEIDYNSYLNLGGLKLESQLNASKEGAEQKKLVLNKIADPNDLQLKILNSWLGN